MCWVVWGFEETLAPSDRKSDIPWAKTNPFSFLNLFRGSAPMRKLSSLIVLQAFPSDMHDTRMVLNKTVLGFDAKVRPPKHSGRRSRHSCYGPIALWLRG